MPEANFLKINKNNGLNNKFKKKNGNKSNKDKKIWHMLNKLPS